jgi:beta-galactosidase
MKYLVHLLVSTFLLGAGALNVLVRAEDSRASAAALGRERLSLNDGWRFHLGDPSNLAAPLCYDRRPKVVEVQENQPADAVNEQQEQYDQTPAIVGKPWILPSGNAFIKDPAKRHQRPAGNFGGDLAFVQRDFDDGTWTAVRLPHDWAIAGPFRASGPNGGMGRLPTAGVGWYRKNLNVPAADKGKRLLLEIDGAMSYAMVWVNGQIVGGWPYGYTSWQLDLTPYVTFGGENQIAIRLDNPPHSSRWYPGAGIYRNVWLTKMEPVHVAQWGTKITTRQPKENMAEVQVDVTVDNESVSDAQVETVTAIFEADPAGRRTGAPVAVTKAATLDVPAKASANVTALASISKPKLWGPPPEQKPNRYIAVTTIRSGSQILDTFETRFGIRTVRFDPVDGLQVNGRRVQIKGVNNHHDLGALGAAFNARAAERQLELLRELGCNAVRMSHNPPAPELLELTDRLGFLVMDEAFDCWQGKKTPLDFHLIFNDWHEQDLRALIRRDRNCPSVILWSIGNEVAEQHDPDSGAAIARELSAIVHEEDPTRPATCAMNFAKPFMGLPAELDVISLNYQGEGIRDRPEFEGTKRIRTLPQYDAFHEKFPNKAILSSELASSFSSRGVYYFPVSKELSDIVRDGRGGDSQARQVSAYELHAVDFGASPDKVFRTLDQHAFVAGGFIWTGWDHLGEPTPYDESRSSYAGIIDMAGFKKDRFYLYQSYWRPELPMAHIVPHWTWSDRVGQVTPVHVFTSGDEAELFLNGKSLGRKAKGKFEYRLRWDDVVYQPGTLEVVAYRNGQPWSKDRVVTAGAAAKLQLECDRAAIQPDGRDLSFVTARIVDSQGVTVPTAANLISFEVVGPGEIAGTDNGDAANFESLAAAQRHAFSGLCLAIVRSKLQAKGEIVITARAQGLEPAQVVIQCSQ